MQNGMWSQLRVGEIADLNIMKTCPVQAQLLEQQKATADGSALPLPELQGFSSPFITE